MRRPFNWFCVCLLALFVCIVVYEVYETKKAVGPLPVFRITLHNGSSQVWQSTTEKFHLPPSDSWYSPFVSVDLWK